MKARAALKFALCIIIALIAGAAILITGFQPFRVFLYTVAAGVCMRLVWPTQDEGDALLNDDED